jgi:hypothetical protein
MLKLSDVMRGISRLFLKMDNMYASANKFSSDPKDVPLLAVRKHGYTYLAYTVADEAVLLAISSHCFTSQPSLH